MPRPRYLSSSESAASVYRRTRTSDAPQRRCERCGCRLAFDQTGEHCSPCQNALYDARWHFKRGAASVPLPPPDAAPRFLPSKPERS